MPSNRAKKRRKARIRKSIDQQAEAEAEAESYFSVGTFKTPEGPRVTYRDPISSGITRLRNTGSSKDPETRLGEIKEELTLRWKRQRRDALEVGGLYREAKRLLPHGRFRPWCIELNLYERSAIHAYIQIHKRCLGRPELVEAIPRTKLQIICQPNFPPDLRESIFDAGGCSGTTENLKVVAQKVRDGELKEDSPEVLALIRDAELPAIEDAMDKLCSGLEDHLLHTIVELRKLLRRDDSDVGIAVVIRNRIQAVEKLATELGE
jgi:hypothetical protein